MSMPHPWHMVAQSPWPITMAISLFSLTALGLATISHSSVWSLVFALLNVLVVAFMWWRDVVRESVFQGSHTLEVQMGLRVGMVLFILSEVMFFFSFFFGFFYLSVSPDVGVGCSWPPQGLESVKWSSVPMLNTIILLSSGVCITWSHHCLVSSDRGGALAGLVQTVILGVVFSFLQMEEYYGCSFTIADSSFGSIFYLATGFHGIHVLIGSVFLMVGYLRLRSLHMSSSHHFGFEAAAWYWHFVDVVWLFLFVCLYWWGS